MGDDILNELATACVCGPLDADGACLSCCARTEIERLRAEVERLTVESKEWDADTERHVARMAGLLHDTANALHGGPLPGGMWSWHDLPAIATAERALADQLAVALLGTASGRIIPTDDEWAGVVKMRSAALDAWEARRG